MESKNQKVIDVLNNLLEINNDRIEGYKTASTETEEGDLKALFSEFAATSYKNKLELTSEIQKLGGTPIEGTRETGKLYRAWMEIKAALTGKDRKSVLKLCEFGEDVAVKNYVNGLKDEAIEGDLYHVLSAHYGAIKAEHDKVKRLRDSVVNEHA